MYKKILAVFCAGLCISGAAVADNDRKDETGDNIVVYGVRLDQVATEVGSSVSILTASDIEALKFDYVLDAIAAMPGVTINQNGSFGGAASVRIRGASSEQTLVIVDGIVSNDPTSPGGGFDFSRLDPSNIERIEVLRGPQSTLWGTDAIGGVVNIVTKRPQGEFAGTTFAQAGSYDSLRGGVDVAGAGDVFDYRLAAVVNSTDGISKADDANGNTEDDGFDSTTLNSSIGANLANDITLRLSVLWTDAENEFDSFSFGAQGNVGDGSELSETEELVGSLTLNVPLFDSRFTNSLMIGYNDIERNSFSNGTPGFSSKGKRLSYRYQGNITVNKDNRLAFGIEREENESQGQDNSIDGSFALYELQATETLTLTAGVRRDDHEVFGSEVTSRFAAAYNPTDLVTLRMSWGEGFKAPTLFQTTFFCCGVSGPNASLRAETSEAIDIGITFRTPDARGEIDLTYFDQDTSDLITFAIGNYENIAEARSTGFELSASYQLFDWLDASLSYANIDAEDGSGAALIRVPRHSGDLRLSIASDARLSGSVLLRYNGEEQDFSEVLSSWTRTDIVGRYALNDSTEIYARIENVFDKQYQQILGYGTPDRSGYIGARFRF